MLELDRRTLLRLAFAVSAGTAAAACAPPPESAESQSEAPTPSGIPSAPPATGVADQVQSEADLVALYDAVIEANPSLASELRPIRDQHVEHAAALGATGLPSASAQVPRGASVRVLLVRQEREAARQRAAACVEEPDGQRARTLALIAASEASHAAALNRDGAA